MMFCPNYDSLVKTLESRGYLVHGASDRMEAVRVAMGIISDGSAGFGGSVSVQDSGLYEALEAKGNRVYWHWRASGGNPADIYARAAHADHYVCSTNALTRNGELINTDGNGNRIAGMFFGPPSVILLIGKNKLVDDLEAGLLRVKNVAAPLNARRLNIDAVPCYHTGECGDCDSPKRICKVTTIIERPSNWVKAMHLILIDEELGY